MRVEERYHHHPDHLTGMDSAALRNAFLISGLLQPAAANFTYSHYDRMVIGGIMPQDTVVELKAFDQLKASYFLERREMGIINLGGDGTVIADGQGHSLQKLDCLYLGKGVKEVSFQSASASMPARFFILSAPAHQAHPTVLAKNGNAMQAKMGAVETANKRTIYKYIHEDGIQSCQLVMGLTILETGSVWNTMPSHTHNRRMEVYCYFDLPEDQSVVHLMGRPQETRHLLVHNLEAVISPPWSIHSGCGTTNYGFIWGMAGENKSFADMDFVEISQLR